VKFRLAVAMLTASGAILLAPVAAHAGEGTPPDGSYGASPSQQVVGTGGFVEPAVQASSTPAAPTSDLPLTGGDVAGLTLLGVALVGGGVILVRRGRKPAPQSGD